MKHPNYPLESRVESHVFQGDSPSLTVGEDATVPLAKNEAAAYRRMITKKTSSVGASFQIPSKHSNTTVEMFMYAPSYRTRTANMMKSLSCWTLRPSKVVGRSEVETKVS